jgi:hypothetical protein
MWYQAGATSQKVIVPAILKISPNAPRINGTRRILLPHAKIAPPPPSGKRLDPDIRHEGRRLYSPRASVYLWNTMTLRVLPAILPTSGRLPGAAPWPAGGEAAAL